MYRYTERFPRTISCKMQSTHRHFYVQDCDHIILYAHSFQHEPFEE
jgi:hypothetical protein